MAMTHQVGKAKRLRYNVQERDGLFCIVDTTTDESVSGHSDEAAAVETCERLNERGEHDGK